MICILPPQEDYDVVITDYMRAKSLFGDTEVQVFRKGKKKWVMLLVAVVFSGGMGGMMMSVVAATLLLTHCGRMTPHGDIDLGKHWLRYWLVTWWHQAITWTGVD